MSITKDSVLKRKADLEAQREMYLNSLQATSGAIQDCDYWLRQIDQLEQTPAPAGEQTPAKEG
jgi:hypothetical protein